MGGVHAGITFNPFFFRTSINIGLATQHPERVPEILENGHGCMVGQLTYFRPVTR